MSEKALRKRSGEWLRAAKLHVTQVEDVRGDVPDTHVAGRLSDGVMLYRVHAWIELKWLDRWPARDQTVARVKFRPGQREWMRDYAKAGGSVAMVLQVAREVLWLPGDWAAEHVASTLDDRGDARRMDILGVANYIRTGEDLKRCLMTI